MEGDAPSNMPREEGYALNNTPCVEGDAPSNVARVEGDAPSNILVEGNGLSNILVEGDAPSNLLPGEGSALSKDTLQGGTQQNSAFRAISRKELDLRKLGAVVAPSGLNLKSRGECISLVPSYIRWWRHCSEFHLSPWCPRVGLLVMACR